MITLILFALLTVIGLGLCLYTYYKVDDVSILGTCLLALGGGIFLGCGIVGIIKNSSAMNAYKTISLQERIDSINNSKKALENKIESNTYTVLDVSSYNDSVREYKTDVATAQMRLNNPWINIFECSAYKNFDVNAVSYLYVE